jgi:hypothetical protein
MFFKPANVSALTVTDSPTLSNIGFSNPESRWQSPKRSIEYHLDEEISVLRTDLISSPLLSTGGRRKDEAIKAMTNTIGIITRLNFILSTPVLSKGALCPLSE